MHRMMKLSNIELWVITVRTCVIAEIITFGVSFGNISPWENAVSPFILKDELFTVPAPVGDNILFEGNDRPFPIMSMTCILRIVHIIKDPDLIYVGTVSEMVVCWESG